MAAATDTRVQESKAKTAPERLARALVRIRRLEAELDSTFSDVQEAELDAAEAGFTVVIHMTEPCKAAFERWKAEG